MKFSELPPGKAVDVRVDSGTIQGGVVEIGPRGLELEHAVLQTKGACPVNVELGNILLPWPSILMVRW